MFLVFLNCTQDIKKKNNSDTHARTHTQPPTRAPKIRNVLHPGEQRSKPEQKRRCWHSSIAAETSPQIIMQQTGGWYHRVVRFGGAHISTRQQADGPEEGRVVTWGRGGRFRRGAEITGGACAAAAHRRHLCFHPLQNQTACPAAGTQAWILRKGFALLKRLRPTGD